MGPLDRREFIRASVVGACAAAMAGWGESALATVARFDLRYILASSMYGYMDLENILPEVPRTGSSALDIWPKVHGSQREQMDEMGEEAFTDLMARNGVSLGCITQYKLGPFALQDELRMAARLGCPLIITGAEGPAGLAGNDLKKAVREFIKQMQPQLEVAEETGVKLAIENHGNNLVDSADAMKWLLEYRPTEQLGIALAPYHLPQNEQFLSELIRSLGAGTFMFYAWEHGQGSMRQLPKDEELMQLPGRGTLDFTPLLQALRDIDYQGWTEIFMHPFPRGVPILETADAVSEEINRARSYLAKCKAQTN